MKKAITLSYIDLFPHLPQGLKAHVRARTYTRRGGVSQGPYSGLNLGLFSGDDLEAVQENMRLVALHMGLAPSKIVALEQVHGKEVLLIDGTTHGVEKGDGLITKKQGIGLLIQHADCGAIVLFDQDGPAIAALHAGWRGLRHGILQCTIERMVHEFGSNTGRLWAGVGPTIGACCYEFKDWKSLLPEWMWQFVNRAGNLDLKGAILACLKDNGIEEDKIYISQECTHCSKRLYSYRKRASTGRLGTIVSLV